MRIRTGNGLLPLNLLIILLIAAILIPSYDALRIALGIPFVLFFPGYTLMATLFPNKDGIGSTERVALSFGLSIAVVPLIGLIVNYTPWGITLESMLYSIASFIFVTSILAWGRSKRLLEVERFNIEFQVGLPGWKTALSVILVIAILGALGVVGSSIATLRVGERFTEFYILGQENIGKDYPKVLAAGEEGKVIVAIHNHEQTAVSYRVEIRIGGVVYGEVGPIVLGHDAKWEEEMAFVSDTAKENQKVEFFLYRDEEAEPYLKPLNLWVSVID